MIQEKLTNFCERGSGLFGINGKVRAQFFSPGAVKKTNPPEPQITLLTVSTFQMLRKSCFAYRGIKPYVHRTAAL